jgi:hypothetical protein
LIRQTMRFHLNRLLACMILILPAASVAAQDIEHPIRMPAIFHDVLIFVEPVSEDGDTLRFFTDSADGTIMYEGTVDRIGLTTTSAIIQDQQQLAAFLPPMDSAGFIPPPLISDGLVPVRADDRMPPHHKAILHDTAPPGRSGYPGDGILGSTWFAGRAWTIDFREHTFYAVPVDTAPAATGDNGEAVSITFVEEGDQRRYHFARVPVVVAGDSISMVLKTGSHIQLTDASREELDFNDPLFPAGLISKSVADEWLREHPEWRVFEGADRNYGSDLVEVPEVQVGPHRSGPVHFAVRRDEAFTEWFSQFTDEPVDGALGADAFRGTRITVNYPRSVLIFHE